MLRRVLQHLYEAIRNHKLIDSIDCALKQGDFQSLARLCDNEDYKKMFGCVNSQTSDTTSVAAAKAARLRIRIDHTKC